MKGNKKAIIAISVIVVCIVAVAAVVLGVAFDEGNVLALNNSQGEVFATVEWDGYDITYNVTEAQEKEYAVYVMEEAKNILVKENLASEEKAYEYIFKNITQINTNLDSSAQSALQKAYDENADLKTASCAMAVTDLKGRLVAVFSSSSEENLSLKKSYAGSTIKPLSVYAPAIDSGKFTWSYTLVDEPVTKIREQDGSLSDWPVNSDGKYTRKNVCLANALAFSTNTVAVKLLQEVGVKNSVSILEEKYGIDVDFEKNKLDGAGETEILGNIALGYLYKGVSVVDMAGYYQVFANEGRYCAPVAVDELFDENGSIYKSNYSSERVMKVETATIMNKMLQRVVSVGTGKGAELEDISVAGKTGTTTDNADNWFVGVTPEYSCAVWHSNIDDGSICPEIFSSALSGIGGTVKEFEGKGNIEAKLYCEKSGLLRGDKCIYCNKGYYLSTAEIAECNECR